MPTLDPNDPDFEDVPTIGPQNPNAVRVETPNTLEGLLRVRGQELDQMAQGKLSPSTITPAGQAMGEGMLNAAAGSSLATPEAAHMFSAPVRAAGRGVESLLDFIGGKATGLKPELVQAYKAAPQTVEALSQAPELRQSQFAEHALGKASSRLGSRADDLEGTLQGQLQDKSVPENQVLSASEFGPKNRANLVTGQIPAQDVYQSARQAGKAAKFAPGAVDPMAEQARVENAGREFGTLRQAVSQAAPEANPTIEQIQKGVEAQQGLKSGRNKPLSFFESGSPDTAANRQAADELNNSTRLERTAKQLQAAKQLEAEPHGFVDKTLIKPAGKAALRLSASQGPAKATDSGAGALLKLILGEHAPKISTPLNVNQVNADDFEDVK